jgi:putative ribosome biogenesis GTPase RsgA
MPMVIFLIFKTFSICFADIDLRVNVPIANNLFVGRDHYLTNIQDYLLDHKTLTLYGSGGIGKTTLHDT